MSEEQLTVEKLRDQSNKRDRFYADNKSVEVTEFIDADLHTQIKFLLSQLATIERDTVKKIKLKLQIAKDAKKKHKSSNQCEETTMGRCTACHFWSGTISAYSELIGESGVID